MQHLLTHVYLTINLLKTLSTTCVIIKCLQRVCVICHSHVCKPFKASIVTAFRRIKHKQ